MKELTKRSCLSRFRAMVISVWSAISQSERQSWPSEWIETMKRTRQSLSQSTVTKSIHQEVLPDQASQEVEWAGVLSALRRRGICSGTDVMCTCRQGPRMAYSDDGLCRGNAYQRGRWPCIVLSCNERPVRYPGHVANCSLC